MTDRKYYDPTGTVCDKGGPMVKYHRSSFDGTMQPYAIYVPAAYSPDVRWPLVISLHGFSSDHVLNLRRVFGLGNGPNEPDADCKQRFPAFPVVGCIVASPYAFGSVGYASQGETDALDVLDEVKRNYSIDDDRVYLTGLSMGGEGTWHIGVRFPHLWAAIAPVCAPTGFFIGPEDVQVFAANLMHLPLHISHGDSDTVVPVEQSRDMAGIISDLGYSCEYAEYPGVDHAAWEVTYADAGLFNWFLQHRRVERPPRVTYTTDRLRYNRAYWLEITRICAWDRLTRIDAEMKEGNIINVRTENVGAFVLRLDEAPVDPGLPLRVICDGKEVFAGEIVDSRIEISLTDPPAGAPVKRQGLEGPVFDALKSRYAVVYGTQTDDPRMRDALRRAGDCAAFWSDWADTDIPALADTAVTDSLIDTHNLALVGNERTNGMIARINAWLPVRFTETGVLAGDAQHEGELGLIEVYPNPLNSEKYVVIVGGGTEGILMKAASLYRDMPDYGVFSESTDFSKPETFVAYGYFNAQWEI